MEIRHGDWAVSSTVEPRVLFATVLCLADSFLAPGKSSLKYEKKEDDPVL